MVGVIVKIDDGMVKFVGEKFKGVGGKNKDKQLSVVDKSVFVVELV